MTWASYISMSGDCSRCDVFGLGSAVQAGTSLASAGIQSAAINRATDAQSKAAQDTLGFQKQVYGDQQQAIAPYQQAGTNALGNLAQGTNGPVAPGSFTDPVSLGIYGGPQGFSGQYNPIWGDQGLNQNPQLQPDFSYTGQDLQNDPGYQFTRDQGLQAQQRQAAATGATGGAAAKAIAQYTTGLANTTFNDAYQRAANTRNINSGQQNTNFGQYLAQNQNLNQQQMNMFNTQAQTYGINQQNQKDIYNAQQQNQANAFNRYAALAGVGQTATQQLNSVGQNAATNIGNTNAQLGNALSAGSAAQGQAWGGAVGNVGNTVGNYLNYKQLYG